MSSSRTCWVVVCAAGVLLAGCDDIPYVAYLEHPLTTIALPTRAACREAAAHTICARPHAQNASSHGTDRRIAALISPTML